MFDLPVLYRWQASAVSCAKTTLIEEAKPHMYMCAPTGTGKSRAIFEIIEALAVPGTHYLMVGMGAIVRQHRNSFLSYGCRLIAETDDANIMITPSGQRIVIETWQTLMSYARCAVDVEPCGFLLFDECHLGGASEGNLSFPVIKTYLMPEKMVLISATTQSANEQLLGQKAGHTFIYSLAEAYEDGLLNPVELVEVHSGTLGTIARVESAYGKSIEQLEVLSDSDLQTVAEKLSNKNVALTQESVRRVVEHRHDVMIDLYRSKHLGQQAIFFSPSIEAAEAACGRFNRKATGSAHAQFVHSDRKDSGNMIDQFRAGRITVLFVVGMLQEGFDMPSLALAFDCRFYRRWNMGRIARFIQKIGRLMRVESGKPPSTYYYARDIMDYYSHGDVDQPDAPNLEAFALAGDYAAGEMSADEFAISAAAGVARVLIEANGGVGDRPIWTLGDIEMKQGEVREVEAAGETVKTVPTWLYSLVDVSESKLSKTVNLTTLFSNSSSDPKKVALLDVPVGDRRPAKLTNLGSALDRYTTVSSAAYDEHFANAIRARQPKWFPKNSAARKQMLLDIPVGTSRADVPKELKGFLQKYTSPTSNSHDPAFEQALRTRHPMWQFKSGNGNSSEKKENILAIPEGNKRPSHLTELGRALARYLTPSAQSYDPEFEQAIRAKNPDWFTKRAGRKRKINN